MSFNVFASGAGNFHYKKDDCIDGSTFDSIKLINELMLMEPSATGVVSTVQGHYTPGITDLVTKMAQMEFQHLLSNAVTFLAMCSGSANGWISLSTSLAHVAWPATRSFARYDFSPGDQPGAEFFKLIAKGLTDTNLNNWAVFGALANVIGAYSNQIGDNATPMLNITLDHS